MMKPNNKAPNWSKPDTSILDFSRCITSNMTTYNKAPEHTPKRKNISSVKECQKILKHNLPFTMRIFNEFDRS